MPNISETQDYVAAISRDLGQPAAPEPDAVAVAADKPKEHATNVAFAKPDLHHVNLASPALQFTPSPTPVHLVSERP